MNQGRFTPSHMSDCWEPGINSPNLHLTNNLLFHMSKLLPFNKDIPTHDNEDGLVWPTEQVGHLAIFKMQQLVAAADETLVSADVSRSSINPYQLREVCLLTTAREQLSYHTGRAAL